MPKMHKMMSLMSAISRSTDIVDEPATSLSEMVALGNGLPVVGRRQRRMSRRLRAAA